jgi:hypothetical protein
MVDTIVAAASSAEARHVFRVNVAKFVNILPLNGIEEARQVCGLDGALNLSDEA